jgi:hypothetical protein
MIFLPKECWLTLQEEFSGHYRPTQDSSLQSHRIGKPKVQQQYFFIKSAMISMSSIVIIIANSTVIIVACLYGPFFFSLVFSQFGRQTGERGRVKNK